jgi:hypothetical protein
MIEDRPVLPIAPRPIEGELLSSWQRRVACRYGLSSDGLAVLLGAKPAHGRMTGFAERDFAPDAGQMRAWASAARLEEGVLQALVLSAGSRPQGCYVWGEGTEAGGFRMPVCVACLDDDADAGRDHHIRRAWALVETFICTRHDRVLIEMCPHCLSSMGWRFKTCDQDARVVCVRCARAVRGLPSSALLADSRFRQALGALSAGLGDAIDDKSSVADDVMGVARLLWTAPHGRGGSLTPFIARVLTDRPLPSVEAQVDRGEPLATIPLGWRMATLIAAAQLLDLAGARQDFGTPSFSLERLMDWTGGSRPGKAATERSPPVAAEPSRVRRPPRDIAEYRAMADAILASDDWRQVQGQSAATRQRMLGRLMTRALDRAPPVQGGAPDPAAILRRRRPIAGRRAAFVPASVPVEPRSRAG